MREVPLYAFIPARFLDGLGIKSTFDLLQSVLDLVNSPYGAVIPPLPGVSPHKFFRSLPKDDPHGLLSTNCQGEDESTWRSVLTYHVIDCQPITSVLTYHDRVDLSPAC
jgi:hypothetical protein